jgi:hypothetical protein
MSQTGIVNSDNVVVTTLLMQVVLLGIIAAASAACGRLYDEWQPFYRKVDRSVYSALILVFALVTVAILIFSDAFTKNWGPLFGTPPFGFAAGTAVTSVFIIDTLVVAFLVFKTGGADVSPFTPLFFLLPTIALLLRESRFHVIMYTLLASACFTVCLLRNVLLPDRAYAYSEGAPLANWIVTISGFWLAVYIGLLPTYR